MRHVFRLTRRSNGSKAAIAALLAALLLHSIDAAFAQSDGSAASLTRVFQLIGERLSLMKPVAHWKFVRDAEIEDMDREAVVLNAAVADALGVGIDGTSVRPFFQAQIDGAKDIQECWFARWRAGEDLPEGEPPDLVEDIRPQLLEIGSALLTGLADAVSDRNRIDDSTTPAFHDAVRVECLSDDMRSEIFAQLGVIRLAE